MPGPVQVPGQLVPVVAVQMSNPCRQVVCRLLAAKFRRLCVSLGIGIPDSWLASQQLVLRGR